MFVHCIPHFYDLSALVGCCSSVSIRRNIYKFLNVCPFDYTAVSVSGKVGRPSTGLTNPIAWVLSVTIAVDCPQSVPQLPCNRKYISIFNIKISYKFKLKLWSLCIEVFHVLFLLLDLANISIFMKICLYCKQYFCRAMSV